MDLSGVRLSTVRLSFSLMSLFRVAAQLIYLPVVSSLEAVFWLFNSLQGVGEWRMDSRTGRVESGTPTPPSSSTEHTPLPSPPAAPDPKPPSGVQMAATLPPPVPAHFRCKSLGADTFPHVSDKS